MEPRTLPCQASDSYTSFSNFSERHHHSISNHLLYDGNADLSRRVLLKLLDDTITSEECNARYLLKAFDISTDDIQLQDDPHPELPSALFPNMTLDSPVSTAISDGQDIEVEHRLENPFLSTPLRLKHFSKLSPTILRGLLRSPSVRAHSPDDSFSEDISNYFPDDPSSFPDSSVSGAYLVENNRDVFSEPITPPLTAKMPDYSRTPSVSYTPIAYSEDGILTGGSKDQTEAKVSFISPLPSPPLESETSLHLANHHSIPSTTIEQFRRVIDELSWGSGKTLTERRKLPPLPEVQVNQLGRIAESLPVKRKPIGLLEVEFSSLLLERAENEEAEADQLFQLGNRLRILASRRRTLAHLMEI